VFHVPSTPWLAYGPTRTGISFGEIFNLRSNLFYTFSLFAGGYFNNLLAVASAAVGMRWVARQKGLSKDILVTWTTISIIPTLFTNFLLNERIFYNLPIPVLSAAGLLLEPLRPRSGGHMAKMLFMLFILFNMNYALRSMASLV
jgi:hypothetical protein